MAALGNGNGIILFWNVKSIKKIITFISFKDVKWIAIATES